MTTVSFRPARRSEAKPLVGIYSESGAGKTLTALILARGCVGPSGRIGMIETEAGRGEAYQGDPRCGEYQVWPIRGDFSPKAYGEAITEAERQKFDALIIDSASHEWEGTGGVLDMAARNKAKGDKGVLVWQQPKIDHQRHFMLRLMQTPIPLVIVCMRAKYPMEQVINRKGEKEWVRSQKLEPKQAEDILFEMFVHLWLDHEHKAHVTKYTVETLRQVIIDGEIITQETGQRLAAWARGAMDPAPKTGSLLLTLADNPAMDRSAREATAHITGPDPIEIPYAPGITKPSDYVSHFKTRQARASAAAEIEAMWEAKGPNAKALAGLREKLPDAYAQLEAARDEKLEQLRLAEKEKAA